MIATAEKATHERDTAEKTNVEYSFDVGDWAVHPSHGVGKISAIEEKTFGDDKILAYILMIAGSELKVIVPLHNAARIGLRPVMSSSQVDSLYDVLAAPQTAVEGQTWNRRLRAYTEMLASGSPIEIIKVLRDMRQLKRSKELSFGEKRLLEHAASLLVDEMALAKGETSAEITQSIDAIFSSPSP